MAQLLELLIRLLNRRLTLANLLDVALRCLLLTVVDHWELGVTATVFLPIHIVAWVLSANALLFLRDIVEDGGIICIAIVSCALDLVNVLTLV